MNDDAMPSAAQIRAARALLGWSQADLAARSGISRRTLTSIESGDERVSPESIEALQAVLEGAGLEFTGSGADEGVHRKG
jgi:transcriptional regulator with XRE-family HTH domain